MIQPEELRIGNWYLSTKFRVPVYCEISDFSQMEALAEGARVDAEIVSQVFEPIPIDEQWLMCFGFERFQGWLMKDAWPPSHPSQRFDLYWSEEDGFCIKSRYQQDISGGYTFSLIKYVHQLQNLYLTLTGKELTVNDSKKVN